MEARHREMLGAQASVKEAIESPLAIYQSASHVNRQVYYRPSSLTPPLNRGYIRVVVDYKKKRIVGNIQGLVVSAHLSSSGPRTGEVLIWPTATT